MTWITPDDEGTIQELRRQLDAMTRQRDKWRRRAQLWQLLISGITPGGSEYCGDGGAERCARYLRGIKSQYTWMVRGYLLLRRYINKPMSGVTVPAGEEILQLINFDKQIQEDVGVNEQAIKQQLRHFESAQEERKRSTSKTSSSSTPTR